tara:strand:- start:6951 stop:7841 length:891 start_codon:yes stop_codon:yes gene_type:complete
MPIHPEDKAVAVSNVRYKTAPGDFQEFPMPSSWPFAQFLEASGGIDFRISDAAFSLPNPILLPALPSPVEPFPPALFLGPGFASNAGYGFRRPLVTASKWWGEWGGATLPVESAVAFVNARIARIVAQWQTTNDANFQPKFWDLDYRTEDEFRRWAFSHQAPSVMGPFLSASAGPEGSSIAWWNHPASASARGAFAGKEETLADEHNSRAVSWLQWRVGLAQEAAVIAQADAAAAAVFNAAAGSGPQPAPPVAPGGFVSSGGSTVAGAGSIQNAQIKPIHAAIGVGSFALLALLFA